MRLAGPVFAVLLLASCNAILGNQDRHLRQPDAGPTADAGLCRLNSDCSAGVCIFQICGPECVGDSDCALGLRCLKTDAGSACVSSGVAVCAATCPHGTTCNESDGQCRNTCDVSGCLEGQTCTGGVCVSTPSHENAPPSSGDSGGSSGSSGSSGASQGGSSAIPQGGEAGQTEGCVEAATRSCAADGLVGNCKDGTETCTTGAWSPCSVPARAADSCSVEGDDANCNGTPNEDCTCVDGATRSCKDDGLLGNCAKGKEICSGGKWAACSITKQPADDCSVGGDDADCNGSANDGCTCVTGSTKPCGPQLTQGVCKQGTQTCVNAQWGTCANAVYAAARDCTSKLDNDCDGKPDNTVDGICTCAIGATQVCGAHAGKDGKGPCKAGSQTCVAGPGKTSSAWNPCAGSVAPAANDTCDQGNDADCDGKINDTTCVCFNGATHACGNCNGGNETCAAGTWGQCQNQPVPPQTFYQDADGDGFGNPSVSKTACTAIPNGYVTKAGDCCDSEPHAFSGSSWEGTVPRTGCGGYDYNCDTVETEEYPYVCTADHSCDCWDPMYPAPGCGVYNGFVPCMSSTSMILLTQACN